MIERYIASKLLSKFNKGKVLLIIGARQTGKSTLIKACLSQVGEPYFFINGDEPDVAQTYANITSTKLRLLIGNAKIVYIDEAQRLPNIGMLLKLGVDQMPDVQFIASGSSAFELSNALGEPLTGRKYEYVMFPLSFFEMAKHQGLVTEKRSLEHRLIFGYYPEIVSKPGEEKELLKLLASSYLYKDLLMLDQIKKLVVLQKLLKALAFQIGSEVSYNELAQLVEADKATVEKYIDLLEKSYVVFRLPSFNRNQRNEIKKGKKVYFYDTGIRNAVLGDFTPIASRQDIGALWENYVIAERLKYHRYLNDETEMFFWRNTQQSEVDLVEYSPPGKIDVFEIKWNPKAKVKFPAAFTEHSSINSSMLINPSNIEDVYDWDLLG